MTDSMEKLAMTLSMVGLAMIDSMAERDLIPMSSVPIVGSHVLVTSL